MKILIIFGTRPEAIKMAPLVKLLQQNPHIHAVTCVTGQHRQMLDQVLQLFKIKPEYDLNIMTPSQTLAGMTSAILLGVTDILYKEKPDMVLVHGDVTTGMASSLAAFYQKIPVGHIEAGLRTGNIYAPWPEEMNRKLIGTLATHHFAPTETAKDNLLHEGIKAEQIIVTGNTVIDALLWVRDKIQNDKTLLQKFLTDFSYLKEDKKLILVTGHRRENFEGGLERVCQSLKQLAKRQDVQILYPVHLNPQVKETTQAVLKECDNIFLIEPQDYLPFVYLMNRASIIVTDSGGIQEEAPSLGKPVLVTREITERPEAVLAGTVKLVGTDSELLYTEVCALLDNPDVYASMAQAHNPYGDGHAGQRIIDYIVRRLLLLPINGERVGMRGS